MKWEELLTLVGQEPLFKTSYLASGNLSLASLRLQLSRWVKAGRLVQLRRGVYSIAAPYSKVTPEPFLIANKLRTPSYVSLQSALAFYGMIPEYVPTVLSVTTKRPEKLQTQSGDFIFQHLKKKYFFGYQLVDLNSTQQAFVALPEKAFLDLVYLVPRSASREYIEELRLQNLDKFNFDRLSEWERQMGSAKLSKAVSVLKELISEGEGEEI